MTNLIEHLSEKRNEDGFTLVELLVVIVILGILAAIVVFAVGGITDKGTNASNSTDMSVLQAGQEANYAKNSQYDTVTNLEKNGFLRTGSTKNYVCIQNNSGTGIPNGVNLDYFVVTGQPSGVAVNNPGCTTQAAAQVPAKSASVTWTASNGGLTKDSNNVTYP